MKCQNLFSWKNKKNIISLLSAKFAQRVVKIKLDNGRTCQILNCLQGTAARKEVNHVLDVFHRSVLYNNLQNFLKTAKGTKVLDEFQQVTEIHCADIVSELRGLADGANVDYMQVCYHSYSKYLDSFA